MSRREAKREACWKAATILRNVVGAGWDIEASYPNDDDDRRFRDALLELVEELERRGRLMPKNP